MTLLQLKNHLARSSVTCRYVEGQLTVSLPLYPCIVCFFPFFFFKKNVIWLLWMSFCNQGGLKVSVRVLILGRIFVEKLVSAKWIKRFLGFWIWVFETGEFGVWIVWKSTQLSWCDWAIGEIFEVWLGFWFGFIFYRENGFCEMGYDFFFIIFFWICVFEVVYCVTSYSILHFVCVKSISPPLP